MPCHAILYMSLLPPECHMVCCRLSLGKTSHAMPCNTIHVLIATRMSHGLLSPVTGKTSHAMSCHAIHVLIAIRISRGLLLPVTGGNKSCHATLYMSLLPPEHHLVCCCLSLGKQVMPCHVIPCHTIHVLIAIRTSHGLLSPVTEGSKSCDNRLHHTIPYASLPSACHIVCCRLSLGEASHAMSVPTIPYNTAISTSHGLLSILSGATKSHHTHTTSVITSHHTTAYCTI